MTGFVYNFSMHAMTSRQLKIVTEQHSKDTTLRLRAQTILRNAILDGNIPAGQKLIERELCERTGASRSILREALVKLEASGLIENQSYRGYRVTQLSVHKIHEIFELRAILETRAAELFTERASDREIDDLKAALKSLEQCLVTFDLEKMRSVKEHYYDILFDGCRNDEIRQALSNVINRVYYLRSRSMAIPARRRASLAEITRLTEALAKRDRVAARAASLAHLEGAREAALQAVVMQNGDTGEPQS